MRSTLPLFPSDDGWPYPDATAVEPAPTLPISMRSSSSARTLTTRSPRKSERPCSRRFGLNGATALSMKELAPVIGCSRTEAGVVLGRAIDKVRTQLLLE